MICCRDSAAGALRAAHGPVLIECRGADDGGLVGAYAEVDVVGGAVGGDSALGLQTGGWVISSEVFDDVVFD